MPRTAKHASGARRGDNGAFTSTQPDPVPSDPEDFDSLAWETDPESDNDGDADYFEAWDDLPTPRTFDERAVRNSEKKARALAKLRVAEMRSAERREGGAMDNQRGKKRGPYANGGLSKRRIQEKKKKLRDDFHAGLLDITLEELTRQLAVIDTEQSTVANKPKGRQLDISGMFSMAPALKRTRARSISISSDEDITELGGSAGVKRRKTAILESSTGSGASTSSIQVPVLETEEKLSDESEIEEEVDTPPEELELAARLESGDAAVNSVVEADNIAEWVDTVLDDAAPLHPDELGSLAADGLKAARKSKDYRSTVLFAALADFYRWMPRMGRLRAVLRVAGDDGNETEDEDERPVDCCMRRVLSLQSDFAGEKSQLELLIEAAPGMMCHFLPKFHPEMNPIEYFWAWIKRWFRERSNGVWQKAKDLVVEALRRCPLPTIRRFFRRANRYASVYRLGATGVVAEFAVKKYRSHRGIQAKDLDVAIAEWEKKAKKLTKAP